MNLSHEQIDFYHTNGYLVIENLFTRSEIDVLQQEALLFNNHKELPNVILEKSGDVRSVFAPHTISSKYDDLFRLKRLVIPSQQLLGEEMYLYQFKLNNKKAFVGDWWEWHQDFPYWHIDDGVSTPQMISAMILLQDTTTIQGPLVFIPQSHKNGIVDFEHKAHLGDVSKLMENTNLENSLSADLKFTIKREIVKDLIDKYNFFEASGPAGTCIFFHPNLFHASNANISPFERNTAIVTYNALSNLPENKGDKNRPDYVCSRDFEPITVMKDQIILV